MARGDVDSFPQYRWLTAIGQKKASSYALAIIIEELSSDPSIQYWNNLCQCQNHRSSPGQRSSWAYCVSLKTRPRCSSTLNFWGHTRLREMRVVPVRKRWQTLWYSRYMYFMEESILGITVNLLLCRGELTLLCIPHSQLISLHKSATPRRPRRSTNMT